jgi:carbon monoxide dehydrogenase subunit G
MAQFTLTKRIDAPLETVFETATDLQRAAEHIRGIEKIELLTTLPVCVGTRWRETRRVMGRSDTQTLEVTAFDPPHSYTIGCDTCGSYFETTFRFAPMANNSTDVTLDIRCEARSLLAKLMSPLGNLMFGQVMRKCMDDDLDDIARVAESRKAAAM